jgi:hypothetical protein
MPQDKQAYARTLERFIEVFCRKRHGRSEGLCPDCQELLDYARGRLARCPFDPKPACKACRIHCYDPAHRRRIQQVMRFSGRHFILRGRLDWLVKYFLGRSALLHIPLTYRELRL